jgi:2-keto-3-deoxy-L-rhamnonate aldolase RhmA
MITNSMKTKMQTGEPVVGVFVSIESPTTVELLAHAGVDFVMVDSEHNAITAGDAINMYRAAEALGVPALTRIGENTQQVISKFMDAGSRGVMMPMINSGEDAERLVSYVKYPPVGRRGLAAVRANEYGMLGPMGDYVTAANDATAVVAQIETLEGIEHADAIINTPGVDIIFLGPTDLSVALGVPGEGKHEKVLDVITDLTKKIVAAGKVSGTIARTPEDYGFWRDRGVGFFLTGANALLGAATTAYVQATKAIEEGR